ncbi:MAG: histidine kinase dimerization/phospho-acceptor domain-containing protein [Planctomycetota bacterium]
MPTSKARAGAGTPDGGNDRGNDAAAVDRLFHELVGRHIGGLIHEVNNPLAVILGFAQEALAGTFDPDRLRSDLLEIIGESRRIGTLLSTWRNLVRGESDGLGDDLRLSLRRAWHLVAWTARSRVRVHGLPLPPDDDDEPDKSMAGPSWPSVLPVGVQTRWWVIVLVALLHRVPGGSRGALTATTDDAALHLAIDHAAPLPADDSLPATCRVQSAMIAAGHGLTISWSDDGLSVRVPLHR